MPNSKEERRQRGEYSAEVGNKAEKSAGKTDEVEEGNVQKGKNYCADSADQQRDQQIANHEASHHCGNHSEGSVRFPAMLEGKQSNSRGAGVLLPCEHEEHEEWYEGRGQNNFGGRAKATS